MLIETLKVLAALPLVELGRCTEGPAPLVARLRARAGSRQERTFEGRARLKTLIAWIDARMPGGANCYRRSLLELALDRGAAREPLFLGLSAAGGPRSGHAWLGADSDGQTYDTVISL